MSIRELEIIKAALEGDIIRQKDSLSAALPEFKEWLKDSEKLLRKVTKEIWRRKER